MLLKHTIQCFEQTIHLALVSEQNVGRMCEGHPGKECHPCLESLRPGANSGEEISSIVDTLIIPNCSLTHNQSEAMQMGCATQIPLSSTHVLPLLNFHKGSTMKIISKKG